MAFQIKQNDSRPIYIAALKSNFGLVAEAPIDLTDATAVMFVMRLVGATDVEGPKVKSACTIEDAVNGIVSYTWNSGDTDTSGNYQVEFEIQWADGSVETVPNNTYLTLEIFDDLG